MVGRLVSFWENPFSGAMLVSGRVYRLYTPFQLLKIGRDFRTFLSNGDGGKQVEPQ